MKESCNLLIRSFILLIYSTNKEDEIQFNLEAFIAGLP